MSPRLFINLKRDASHLPNGNSSLPSSSFLHCGCSIHFLWRDENSRMPITGLVNLKNDDLSHEAAAACTLLMEVVVAPDPFELSHFDIRGEYIVQRAAAHFTTSTSTHWSSIRHIGCACLIEIH